MLRKINYFVISLIFFTCIVPAGYIYAAEMKRDEKDMRKNNCIRISMSLDEINNLKCKDFVPFSEKEVKHKVSDNRLRKYYRSKPLPSVAMIEIDINSYFEIVFESDRVAEINQYDLKGNLIKTYTEIYCWI